MKHYFYTLLILVLFSCSNEGPELANKPPQAFEVTAKVEQNGTDVTLTWTEAIDAEGDVVTYAVVYGADTLSKGLTTRAYTIKNLPYETEIVGTVVASDAKGGKTESAFKVKTPESIYVSIPDVEFEKFLISEKIDDVLDGRLLRKNALGVVQLYMWNRYNIESLSGLEAFKDLEYIEIRTSKVKEISLKGLSKLTGFFIDDNVLAKVDLSGSPLLEFVQVLSPSINELDTRKNLRLKRLFCTGREFRTLFLENNLELIYLNVEGANNLSPVDLSKNVNLEELDFWRTNVEKCDLTNNVKLKKVRLLKQTGSNIAVDFTLPKSSPLYSLEVSSINFSKIDLSGFSNLSSLSIYSSNIESINLHSLTKLSNLAINDSQLQSIDLSENHALADIRLRNNKLTELSLCNNLTIRNLDCRSNNISTIYINKSHTPTSNWQKDATATYKVCD